VFGTLALFPPCIVNASYYYVYLVLLALVLLNPSRCVPASAAAALCVGGLLVLESPRTVRVPYYIFLFSAASWVIVIYDKFHRERELRKHFEIASVSKAHLRASEDEVAMQRRMYELLLPPFLANTMIERKLSGTSSFMTTYDQVCVVAVRMDGLCALLAQLSGVPLSVLRAAETALLRIEAARDQAVAASCPAEYAAIRDELLSKVSTLGDEVMLGGPLTREDAPDDVLALTAAAVLRFMRCLLLERHEDSSPPGARMPLPRMTVVAAWNHAVLALLKSECLSLQLIGTAAVQAHALLRAAPPGFVGCTERFKLVAAAWDADQAAACRIGPGHVWRLRGAGSVLVSSVAVRQQEEGLAMDDVWSVTHGDHSDDEAPALSPVL
jgi:hypothetical protein